MAAASDRRSLASGLLARHDGRQGRGPVRHGTESGRRRAECAARAQGARASSNGWSCATWSRSRRRPSGTTRPKSSAASCGPDEIGTEVFFFPAAGHAEKDGTFTNTQRLLQWHEKAVDPPGDARSEAWFIYHLGTRLKEKAAARSAAAQRRAQRADLGLSRSTGRTASRTSKSPARRSTATRSADRTLRRRLRRAEADGSTACGCWIYSGVFPRRGENRARERQARGRYGHGWGFAWPADRRILYNRASARPDGQPVERAQEAGLVGRGSQRVDRSRRPDFTKTKPPDYRPPAGRTSDAALAGDEPFIMHADGLGWLWVPTGLEGRSAADALRAARIAGREPALSAQQTNPAARSTRAARQPVRAFARSALSVRADDLPADRASHGRRDVTHAVASRRAAAGALLRDLAGARARSAASSHGGWVTIITARGAIEARALVTPRMRRYVSTARRVHQVGVP